MTKPDYKCSCGHDEEHHFYCKREHPFRDETFCEGKEQSCDCKKYEPVIPLAQVRQAIDDEMKICRAAELKGAQLQAIAIAELMVLKRKLNLSIPQERNDTPFPQGKRVEKGV